MFVPTSGAFDANIRAQTLEDEVSLATGGFGTVNLCLWNRSFVVAVKRIRPDRELDVKIVARFQHEMSFAAVLQHPNLVHMYGTSSMNGLLAIVMEYMAGGSLNRLLKSGLLGQLSWSKKRLMALQMVSGLSYMHHPPHGSQRHGVLHSDLKLDNVLTDIEYNIKLADFGAAKMIEEFTRDSSALYKPYASTTSYYAPEMLENHSISRKTDIWALGLCLYALAVCKGAFVHCTNEAAVLTAITKRNITPVPDSVPLPLRLLIEWSLSLESRARPTAALLKELLEEWQQQAPDDVLDQRAQPAQDANAMDLDNSADNSKC